MENNKSLKDIIVSEVKKYAILLWRLAVAAVLLFFTWGLVVVRSRGALIFGIFLLIFITLPTIFVVYFKKEFTEKHPGFAKPWKVLRIIYAIVIILFTAAIIWGIFRVHDRRKTQTAIDFISSEKITLGDVLGNNLPPVPDEKLNNSTISGIDANKNGIRDDVELAIFKEYPNSAKVRAAELQYAQALQLELTQVFNSPTLVAVMQRESRGIDCIGESGPKVDLNDTHEKILSDFSVTDRMQKEVEDIVINTSSRKALNSGVFEKYMTGYASLPGEKCDIELSSLPN